MAAEHRCPNCGALAVEAYCGQCGQPQRDRLRASLRTLASEGLEELLDVDAKIAVSLRRLLFRPGALTSEYLAGRRARYLRPLRLYLSISLVFFVVASLTGSVSLLRTEIRQGDGDAGVRVGASVAGRPVGDAASVGPRADPRATATAGTVEASDPRRRAPAAEQRAEALMDMVERHMPKAFFALVPMLALALGALYRRAGRHYAEHLIFALHFQSFAFVVLTLSELTTMAWIPAVVRPGAKPLLLVWLLAYLFLALRRVYGQSPARTAGKLALLLPAYGASFLIVAALLIAASLALA